MLTQQARKKWIRKWNRVANYHAGWQHNLNRQTLHLIHALYFNKAIAVKDIADHYSPNVIQRVKDLLGPLQEFFTENPGKSNHDLLLQQQEESSLP